jgi:hypothetical protein
MWTALTIMALALALAASGCGGGDESSSATATATDSSAAGDAAGGGNGTAADDSAGDSQEAGTPVVSKATFIKRGDAICEAGRLELSKAAEPLLSAKPSEREELEMELVSSALVPVLEADIEGLRALGMPEGDEEQVEAILEGFEGILQTAEDEPEAFLAPGVNSPDPWRKTDKKAEAYGFAECPRS